MNDKEVEIILNRKDILSGKLISPSVGQELELVPEINGEQTVIRIPADSFSGYAAVEWNI